MSTEYYLGIICPYCECSIEEDEAKIFDGEDWVHLGCEIESNDDESIWGYDNV